MPEISGPGDTRDRIIGTIPSDHNLILIKAVLP